MELWADGNRLLVARGENSDELVPKSWDLSDYHLSEIEIRIVDQATGRWGHVHADQFEFSPFPVIAKPDRPVPPISVVESYARANGLVVQTLHAWCMHFKKLDNLQSFAQRIERAKAPTTDSSMRNRISFKTVNPLQLSLPRKFPKAGRSPGRLLNHEGID